MKTVVDSINKVVRIGSVPRDGNIFCKIEFKGEKLSISGVIGPKANGDARGSCGQICMSFKESDKRGHLSVSDVTFAPGWDEGMLSEFLKVWDAWHLNDMRAGCQHQTGPEWNTSEEINLGTTTKTAGWVYEKEHPHGLLCKPCPVCGYKYGSAWRMEPVPESVLEFLESLPNTDTTPAWV